jgi:FXSXX-COOH protein
MDADPETLESDLVDLTGIDLNALAEMPRDVLGNAVRRFLRREDESDTQYAAFDSVLSSDQLDGIE